MTGFGIGRDGACYEEVHNLDLPELSINMELVWVDLGNMDVESDKLEILN